MARREPQGANQESTYGLGIYVESYRDVRNYGHAGHANGYASTMFFLPDHGVAAVMLTNIDSPNPLTSQFRRKLFEILFDGRDEAKERFSIATKNQKENQLKDVARVDFTPGRAFFEPFFGTYENALYGRVAIRIDGSKGAVLDAGEWKATLGRRREEDGTEALVGTYPFPGWPSFARKAVFERRK